LKLGPSLAKHTVAGFHWSTAVPSPPSAMHAATIATAR
jgi:hypothetical protein